MRRRLSVSTENPRSNVGRMPLPIVIIAAAMAANEVRAQKVWPQRCPVASSFTNWSETRCPATMTCSPNGFSAGGGWGCCPWPNAVSCSSGFACCPEGTACNVIHGSGYETVYNCTAAGRSNTTSKCPCKPGTPDEPSSTLKNVLIIGDSLTIGYTGAVASALSDLAKVQHVPWDNSDGGAEESAYFLQCFDNWVGRSPSGMAYWPDAIYFNSGMHNLQTSGDVTPGQSGLASAYSSEMREIMTKMKAYAASSPGGNFTRLIYGLTTPYLCDASVDGVITGTLNAAAAAIAASLGIEVVDPHGPIVNKCGVAPTQSCFGVGGCFCPHCPGGNPNAYSWLAENVIAPAIRVLLS